MLRYRDEVDQDDVDAGIAVAMVVRLLMDKLTGLASVPWSERWDDRACVELFNELSDLADLEEMTEL